HAGSQAARLSHARRRKFMGAVDQWFAAGRCLRNDSARQPERRCKQSNRTLLRHAQRQAVRIYGWRRLVDDDPRRLAADYLREDGHDQLTSLNVIKRTCVSLKRFPEVWGRAQKFDRSEEHTSELQSPYDLVCRLLLEKKKNKLKIPDQSQTPAKLKINPTKQIATYSHLHTL